MDQYRKNILLSWLAILANISIAFLLTPFLIESLGKYKYGIWLLVNSVIGYLNIVELGINISTGRFVNLHIGRKENDKVSQVISTTTAFYLMLPIVVLPFVHLLSPHIIPFLFNNQEVAKDVSSSVFLVVTALLLNIAAANIRVRIYANSRFDIVSIIELSNVLVRTIMLSYFIFYSKETKISDIALSTLAGATLAFIASIFFANNYGIKLKLSLSYINVSTFKKILKFSSWVFISNLAVLSINYSDNIIISVFINAESVAIYSIGFMLSAYSFTALSKISQVKMPAITQIMGREDNNELLNELNNLHLFLCIITIPAIASFILISEGFVKLWLGPDFKESALICVVLVVAQIPVLTMQGIGSALWGKEIIKDLSLIKVAVAVSNIVLSIALLQILNSKLLAIALGTMTVRLIEGIIIMPTLAKKYLNLKISSIFKVNFVFGIQCYIIFTLFNIFQISLSDSWVGLILNGSVTFLFSSLLSFLFYRCFQGLFKLHLETKS